MIGKNVKQRATVKGLGLRGVGSEKELENTPSVRGMIKKVINFLEIKNSLLVGDIC